MSLSKRDFFDQPIRNVGSETIPAFAVVEVKSPGLVTFAGREWFTVGKPSSQGKVYFVNGPFEVPANGTSGAAMPYRAPGVHALFKPDLDPATNDELGPIDGQWYLGEGNGFFVVGDIQGSPASQPGFPVSPSTLRVRVMTTAVANETDRIRGRVASTASETTPQFLIDNIVVLSGKDPRPEPHSPTQTVVIENIPPKAYENGVDYVTAVRNKTDGKWYPEITETIAAEPLKIYLARLVNPSSGILAAELGVESPGAPVGSKLRMFSGYAIRYTVLDIPDPGFGEEGDLAEPEREDSLSITWITENMPQADQYPDTIERESNNHPQPELVQVFCYAKATPQVGDRLVIVLVTTEKGRERYLIIGRDCG